MDNFVSLLIFGSIVAVPILAHKKGKRWWIWLIPTLFLGPLMFLPLFLSRQKPQSEMKSDESKGLQSSQLMDSVPHIEEHETSLGPDVGFVYVVSNPSLPDNLVKIGFTRRDPSERLSELDQAGLPTEYIEHYRIFTRNARELEIRLHNHFAAQRLREDKEFFTVTPHEVYEVLKSWGVSPLEL